MSSSKIHQRMVQHKNVYNVPFVKGFHLTIFVTTKALIILRSYYCRPKQKHNQLTHSSVCHIFIKLEVQPVGTWWRKSGMQSHPHCSLKPFFGDDRFLLYEQHCIGMDGMADTIFTRCFPFCSVFSSLFLNVAIYAKSMSGFYKNCGHLFSIKVRLNIFNKSFRKLEYRQIFR